MGPPDNQDPAAERGIFLFLRRGIRGLWPLDPGSGAYREDVEEAHPKILKLYPDVEAHSGTTI